MKKLLCLICAILLVCAGCAQSATTPAPAAEPEQAQDASPAAQASSGEAEAVEEVLIASVWPLTGGNAEAGTSSKNAVDLAVEKINAAGGVKSLGGAKIKLIYADAQSDVSITVSEMERIITNYDVSGFVGCQASALTLAATEVSERASIPFVTFSQSDSICARGFEYVYQMVPTATQAGMCPVQFIDAMYEGAAAPKVAVLYEDSTYGTSFAETIQKTATELGQEIVLFEAYASSITDASTLMLKLKESQAEVVYNCSYLTDAVLITQAMKAYEIDIPLLGTAGQSHADYGPMLGDDANYAFTAESVGSQVDREGLAEVAAEYQERFGEAMESTAMNAYTCIYALYEGIEAAGSTDPEAINAAMKTLDVTEGPATWQLGGHCYFDETGHNAGAQEAMFQWRDGKLFPVWPAEEATADLVWPVPAWSER